MLQREFGWEVVVLDRSRQQWNGEVEEIDIFGQATDPARPERTIRVVGEAKHNLTSQDAEQFARKMDRARTASGGGGVRCVFRGSGAAHSARAAEAAGDSAALLL